MPISTSQPLNPQPEPPPPGDPTFQPRPPPPADPIFRQPQYTRNHNPPSLPPPYNYPLFNPNINPYYFQPHPQPQPQPQPQPPPPPPPPPPADPVFQQPYNPNPYYNPYHRNHNPQSLPPPYNYPPFNPYYSQPPPSADQIFQQPYIPNPYYNPYHRYSLGHHEQPPSAYQEIPRDESGAQAAPEPRLSPHTLTASSKLVPPPRGERPSTVPHMSPTCTDESTSTASSVHKRESSGSTSGSGPKTRKRTCLDLGDAPKEYRKRLYRSVDNLLCDPKARKYDPLDRSITGPPLPIELIKSAEYRNPKSVWCSKIRSIFKLQRLRGKKNDLVFAIWWSIPWIYYYLKYTDADEDEQYKGDAALQLRINYMELRTPPPPPSFRNDFPCQPKCDYQERDYQHLFPLLLPSFSHLNVKEERIRFLWDKSFEKHLSHGDGLDIADCAEMMICCHHNFLMPYLLQEMHQNARRFADRETRKYGVECLCEEFREEGMQGRYRMRLGDLWVLVRDLLGAAFFPQLATYTEKGKKGERTFLTGIGLYVNKAMRPTANGVKWSSSTRDQFVIF